MTTLWYKRTIPVPLGGEPNLGELQHAGWLLGLALVRLEYDESGDREDPEWMPRWHAYFAPAGLEEVKA